MASIRSRDTKPELLLRRALWARELRGYRCHRKTVKGRPDVSFGPSRVAVFVDGCFWHGHPDHFQEGQSGEYWDQKIRRNQQRDQTVNEELLKEGWTVLRFWDIEIIEGPGACAQRVGEAVKEGLTHPEPRRSRVLNFCDGSAVEVTGAAR